MPSSSDLVRGGLVRGGLVLLMALAAPSARAADRGLKDLEAEVGQLQKNAEQVKQNFTERSGLISMSTARSRYEDALFLYLIKDYTNAAVSFYILVQSRALGSVDLARDSEWYLAECLFEMGNYRTAEEAFRAIADKGQQHPYFNDAVRRLLEVYAIIGDVDRFDRFYADYIVTGKVPGSDLVNYTLAKSFYRRGEFGRARSMLEKLPTTSAYYTRARYFVGVLLLREKNYAQAIEEYRKVVAIPPTDSEQEQVVELSQLALARLHYELGQFDQANEWYGKIKEGSTYFADKLYESVWTYVKQASVADTPEAARPYWSDALSRVSIFLLAFPEHRYAAPLKILEGHLNMKLGANEEARIAYQRVVDEYTPVLASLDAVESPEQLRKMLEGVAGVSGASASRLPPAAMSQLLADATVARAARAWKSVDDQKAELAQAERLVGDLQAALAGKGSILGDFVRARQELAGIRGSLVSLRDRIVENEATWIKSRVPSQYRAEVLQIQKDRAAAIPAVAAADVGAGTEEARRAAIVKSLEGIRTKLRGYRGYVTDSDAAAYFATSDRVWSAVEAIEAATSATSRTLVDSEARESQAVRARLTQESARVVDLRTVIATDSTAAEGVALRAVRTGVRDLEDAFREQVIAADKGIVDVYWLRKSAATDQVSTLGVEQATLLRTFDEQFRVVRGNLDR